MMEEIIHIGSNTYHLKGDQHEHSAWLVIYLNGQFLAEHAGFSNVEDAIKWGVGYVHGHAA